MAKKVILLVLAFILITACGMPSQPKPSTSNLPVIQVTPGNQAQPAQAAEAAAGSPSAVPTQDTSPEATVRAFLSAYEQDTALMANYMTPQLQAQIPAEGPRAILEASGPLQSYLISAGRMMGDTQSAEVDVSMVVDEVQITRGFVLVQQNGTWLIDRIDFKNN